MQRNLELVGAPEFSDEDQAFARGLQKSLGIEEKGLSTAVEVLADGPDPLEGGSTDVAEVSYITPTVSFNVTTAAADVPWHSWATSASHGTSGAVKGASVAARVIALMGVDMLTDADLLRRAKEYFVEMTGGKPYEAPIPKDQEPPLPVGTEAP
jgi:aminobenzoyl-glutamate utilization protein B